MVIAKNMKDYMKGECVWFLACAAIWARLKRQGRQMVAQATPRLCINQTPQHIAEMNTYHYDWSLLYARGERASGEYKADALSVQHLGGSQQQWAKREKEWQKNKKERKVNINHVADNAHNFKANTFLLGNPILSDSMLLLPHFLTWPFSSPETYVQRSA